MTPFLVLFLATLAWGKIYHRCELARELKFAMRVPDHEVATWVCIAQHESSYNTSVTGYMTGDGSGDHGLFQISDKYWCSPPGRGKGCDMTCSQLIDDDISDDFDCAKKIREEHNGLSGDGFTAWAVYNPHCKGGKALEYVRDCFNDFDPSLGNDLTSGFFAHGFFGPAARRPPNTIPPTSTRRPSFNPFFTQTAIPSFNPSVSRPAFPTRPRAVDYVPRRPTTNQIFSFGPTTNNPTSFFPVSGRTTIFGSSSPFFIPSNTRPFPFSPSTNGLSFFPSTSTAANVYSNTPFRRLDNEPVFLVNGVKWN